MQTPESTSGPLDRAYVSIEGVNENLRAVFDIGARIYTVTLEADDDDTADLVSALRRVLTRAEQEGGR